MKANNLSAGSKRDEQVGLGHNSVQAVRPVPIDSVQLLPGETRTYTDRDVKRATRVVGHFGVPLPLLIGQNGGIIAGQLLWLAAKAKGETHVPVIEVQRLSPLEERMLSAALG